MSANRYDTRRQLVVKDANVLGGLCFQSSLLPDAPRRAFKQLLNRYVGFRTQFPSLGHERINDVVLRAAAQSEEMQNQVWIVLKGAAEGQPAAPIAATMLERLVDAISIQRERLFAWEGRVPDAVIWLLFFGALTDLVPEIRDLICDVG